MPVEPGYAPAGSSGVSVTSNDGFITVTPSPGTGVMVLSADVPAAPTAGHLAVWNASQGLLDGGPVPSGGGFGTPVTLDLSGTILAGNDPFYIATSGLTLISGQRFRLAGTIKRSAAATVGLGFISASGASGYKMLWQSDTNVVEYRITGTTTAVSLGGITLVPPIVAAYYNFELDIIADTGINNVIACAIDKTGSVSPKADVTINLTAGTWFPAVTMAATADCPSLAYYLGNSPGY